MNNTSSLQIHSIMYRFHPSVSFRAKYPNRQRIVEEVTKLWKRYHLDQCTQFDTRVERVWKDEATGRWHVNDVVNGSFDGIIAAIGTCGDPIMPHIPGQEKFGGHIYHSSELNGKDAAGRKVLVIGGGASAVEAIEFVVQQKAEKACILARVSCVPFSPSRKPMLCGACYRGHRRTHNSQITNMLGRVTNGSYLAIRSSTVSSL